MAKLTKPNYTNVWASAAGGGSVAPDTMKIQTGWIVERPDFEHMNWVQNRQDTGIAYAFQMGVPEWDSTVEYQYSSNNWASFIQYKGLVYKAIQTGTNKNPETQTAYWARAFDDFGDAQDVQDNLDDHITDYGTLENLTNAATARSNLDVYSTTEAAEKNGDAGETFDVDDGVSPSNAVNKGQLDTVESDLQDAIDTKADLNGDALEAFLVKEDTNNNAAVAYIQMMRGAAVAGDRLRFPAEWGGTWEIKTGTTTQNFGDTDVTIGFPQPFDNTCLFAIGIILNPSSSDTEDIWVQLKSKTSSGAIFKVQGSVTITPATRSMDWFAVGY